MSRFQWATLTLRLHAGGSRCQRGELNIEKKKNKGYREMTADNQSGSISLCSCDTVRPQRVKVEAGAAHESRVAFIPLKCPTETPTGLL